LVNGHSTIARVAQLRVCQRTYMSTHVYINTCLGYRFGKVSTCLYQRVFMSSLGYINYHSINVLFIATLLYINLKYQTSTPVLRIWTIFDDRIRIQLLKKVGSSIQWCWPYFGVRLGWKVNMLWPSKIRSWGSYCLLGQGILSSHTKKYILFYSILFYQHIHYDVDLILG
jgi:hypothetical protein